LKVTFLVKDWQKSTKKITLKNYNQVENLYKMLLFIGKKKAMFSVQRQNVFDSQHYQYHDRQ